MKIIDNIKIGDKIRLVSVLKDKSEYSFVGYAEEHPEGFYIAQKNESGKKGYIIPRYDWDLIEKL